MRGEMFTPLLGIDGRPALWPRMGIGTYVRNLLLMLGQSQGFPGGFRVYFDQEPDEELRSLLAGKYTVLKGGQLRWSKWSLTLELRKHPVKWYLTFVEKGIPFLGNGSTRYCVVINDMIPWAMRDVYLANYLRRAYYFLNMLLLRCRVDRAWTISEFSRGQVSQWLGLDRSNINILTLGIKALQPSPEEVSDLETTPYFVAMGGAEPRKNNAFLVELFEVHGPRWGARLLLIGGPWRDRKLEPGSNWVKGIPSLSDAGLRLLLSRSHGLLFPSLMEGFGLPAIEAMAADCPVICSDSSALPEVVKDAGILVPTGDPNQWAAAIEKLLTDSELHGALIRKGKQQVQAHTVEKMYESFINNVYMLEQGLPSAHECKKRKE